MLSLVCVIQIPSHGTQLVKTSIQDNDTDCSQSLFHQVAGVFSLLSSVNPSGLPATQELPARNCVNLPLGSVSSSVQKAQSGEAGRGAAAIRDSGVTGQAVSPHTAAAALVQGSAAAAHQPGTESKQSTEVEAGNSHGLRQRQRYSAGGKEWKESAGLDLCAVWRAPIGKHQDQRVNKSTMPCGLQLPPELIQLCP